MYDDSITGGDLRVYKRIKTGKDGISQELIKWGGNERERWIGILFRKAWEEDKIPMDWEINVILPVHKEGNEIKCENYRAICLASVFYKMYTGILERKLRIQIENKMEEEQAVFKKERQTVVKKVIEKAIEQGKELYLIFIDPKAAFDTVNSNTIWECLEEMKVTKKLREVIESEYNRVIGQVRMYGEYFWNEKKYQAMWQLKSIVVHHIYTEIIQRRDDQFNQDIEETVQVQSLVYADDVIRQSLRWGHTKNDCTLHQKCIKCGKLHSSSQRKVRDSWWKSLGKLQRMYNIQRTKTKKLSSSATYKTRATKNNKPNQLKKGTSEKLLYFSALSMLENLLSRWLRVWTQWWILCLSW